MHFRRILSQVAAGEAMRARSAGEYQADYG